MKNEKTIDTGRRDALKKIVLFPFAAATVLKKTGCRSKTEEIDPLPDLLRQYQAAVNLARTYPRNITTVFNETFDVHAETLGLVPQNVLDSARVTSRYQFVNSINSNRENILELQRLSREIVRLSGK